ncbi:MAG: RHS repeat-associated core domain-containing protein [Candidatus Acidiferrales bacterium]
MLVADADGTVYTFTLPIENSPLTSLPTALQIEDRNGNQVNIAYAITANDTASFTVTDTAKRPLISTSGFASPTDTVSIYNYPKPFYVTWGTASYNFTPTATGVVSPCAWVGTGAHSVAAVTAIELPNGQSYQFQYDSTYGVLKQITFPNGGYVAYTWGYNAQSGVAYWEAHKTGNSCSAIYDVPAILTRTVSYNGTTVAEEQVFDYTPTTWTGHRWTNKQTIVTTYDRIRGTSFQTTYNYVPAPPGGDAAQPLEFQVSDSELPVEQSIVYQSTTGAVLRTITKGWYDVYEQACELDMLDNGLIGGTFYQYGPGAVITDKTEYNYNLITSTTACQNGSTSPTSITPTRETVTAYQPFVATPIYPNPAILDRASSIITKGAGTRAAETDFAYDGSSLQQITATAHDDTNYAASYNVRGNVSKVTKQCFPSCANAVRTFTYDQTGQLYSAVDPNNNTTFFSFADSYTSGAPPGNTNAYLTKITLPQTNGINHITNYSYGYADGQLTVVKDENLQPTSYSYNDNLDRLTSVQYPDGGQTTYEYNDAVPSVTTVTLATPDPSISRVVTMDSMEHATQTQTTSVTPAISTNTTYDGLGKVYTASNPHTTASNPTDGTTTYTYDAIGRTTLVGEQDGSTISTVYSGNTTTITDEAGHQRQTVTDALGRVTSVTEDPNGLNYLTSYAYDTLDDLHTVVEAGSQSRTFNYDSLARLTSAVNPEIAGTVSYSYDPNGNVVTKTAPAPNQTGTAQFTASMTYDGLNRIQTTTYTGGSPTAALSFTYDVSSVDSLTALTNPIGRLVKDSAVSSAGTTSFYHDYDRRGRVADVWECVTTNCPSTWHSSYQYDYSGSLMTYSDGIFASYTQAFDGAARLTNVTSTYPSGSPTSLATVNDYFPPGEIQELAYGNGLAASNVYNTRLQVCRITFNSSAAVLQACAAATPAGNFIDFAYGYNQNTTSPTDNGSVASWTAAGKQTFSHNYTYDKVNRISSMTGSGGTCTALNWTYDAWGNRQAQTGPPGGGTCLQPQYTYLSNNQISGYGYDSAGNVTSQNGSSYMYDNENRQVAETTSGLTATYVYDAHGRRVQKTVGSNPATFYAYNKDGQVDAWLTPSGRALGYVYINGQILAQYYNGSVYFHHHDHLGSTRLVTAMNQGIQQCMGYYPFGEEDANQCTPSVANNFNDALFTGKERDTESGNDNFGARYDSSSSGRFLSPDPSNLSVDFWIPQTWNRYTYALDNPLTMVDRNGQWPTRIHNEIIEQAFPGLSSADIQTLKDASYNTDYKNDVLGFSPQDPNVSFVHNQSDGTTDQDPRLAEELTDQFIMYGEANARALQDAWVASGHDGICPAALTAFGNVLHTITDGTSPAHAGHQPWYGTSTAANALRSLFHVLREQYISKEQLQQAVFAARLAFLATFGFARSLQAITQPVPCVTIQGPNGPITKCYP